MLKRSDSRGLSTIVATLIIILLVLVAAGIIWVVVRNVIQGNAEQIDLGKLTLDLAIEKVQFSGNDVGITVQLPEHILVKIVLFGMVLLLILGHLNLIISNCIK